MSEITLYEGAAAATPPSGGITIYAKVNHRLYWKTDTGVEIPFYPEGAGTGDLNSDGSVALTVNWDMGNYQMRALQFYPDATTGTPPFVVDSTTLVANLNVDQLDGYEASAFVLLAATDISTAGFFLDEDNMISDDPTKVASQQSIKAYVDMKTAGALMFQTGYNASTNSPDLTTSPNSILKGQYWVVSAAGTSFYSLNLEIGDTLIANQDDPSLVGHWTVLQTNLDAASIKTLYESNSNTNAYPDADVAVVAAALVDGDFSGANGEMQKTGSGTYSTIKCDFAATADPDANYDNTAGWAVGSRIINVNNDTVWTCVDASTAAALWTEGGGAGGLVPQFKTASFTAVAGNMYFCDTSGGPIAVTYPAGVDQDNIAIYGDATSRANNITITPDGSETIDNDTSFVIDQNFGQANTAYDAANTNWVCALTGMPEVVNVEAYIIGAQTFIFRAGDFGLGGTPPSLGTAAGNYGVKVLAFDDSAYEAANLALPMPNRWNEGQFKYRIIWQPLSTGTGTVQWGVYGNAATDGSVMPTSSVGASVEDAASGTANAWQTTIWSAWFSFGNTPDLTKMIALRVQRNGPSGPDTYVGDANFIAIELQWVSNAATDD